MATEQWPSEVKIQFLEFFSKYEKLNEKLDQVSVKIKEMLINSLAPLDSSSFESIPVGEGVYLFCYECDMDKIYSLWEKHKKGCKDVSPFNKTKFEKCEKLENGTYPMYIGKSENLQKRIKEHWNEPCESETKAMRLKLFLEDNGLEHMQVRYSYVNLDDVGMQKSTYYVCSAIERLLKENLNPFIGR